MHYVLTFFAGVVAGAFTIWLITLDLQRRLRERARAIEESENSLTERQRDLAERTATLRSETARFDARAVTVKELEAENRILKRDLQNVDVNLNKFQLDVTRQRHAQEELAAKVDGLGKRYLAENVKWIGSSITSNNFVACKQRLLSVVERCRGIGYEVSGTEEQTLVADLKAEFEKAVRAMLEREEQARIKAQIREEQLLEREVERELKQLERERAAIQAALEKALADAQNKHSEEVEQLRTRLAEAEEKARRAISQAQLTKAGHVYVISNMGAFGDGVLKIGMTRRLEPLDRVRELGSASVPFPFDVHMMISSGDAPKLETALHQALHRTRLNKVNPRKEFFRTDLETVRQIVEENHGQVAYVADAEALEYRQSITVTDEDAEFIEKAYEEQGIGLVDDD